MSIYCYLLPSMTQGYTRRVCYEYSSKVSFLINDVRVNVVLSYVFDHQYYAIRNLQLT